MPASEFEAEALVRILADSVIIAKTFSLHDTMHRTGSRISRALVC